MVPQSAVTCGRCAARLEDGDLRCPVCALPVPAAGRPQAAAAKVLRCPDCHAVMAYSAERRNPACGFCDGVLRVEEPVDPVEEPQGRLPLRVSAEAARQALVGWLGTRGFFRPGDLAKASTVDSLHLLYWAAWVCDAEATVSWSADSDAGSNRSDWAPHAGKTGLRWQRLLVSASRGLTAAETDALTPAYDVSAVEPVPDGDGATEQFDVPRSAARRRIMDAIDADAVQRLQQGTIPGRRFRNVHASALLTGLTTQRLALPAWVLTYRYGGRPYRAVVHGQKAGAIIGATPLSWARVLAVGAAVVAGLGALAALVWVLSQAR